MQNIFIELLPPWIETGLQPAFYDKESGTVLQQVSRMWAKMIELGKGVNSYIAKFNELYTYVHDYFDNLDVQAEINNKLDAMVEAGTLQEIIGDYLNATAVWGFDTVADMKASTNLINGSFAKTLGYHTLNDGGEGVYKIRTITNADVVDEGLIISLNDQTLIAELVITDDRINVKQFGAYGDNTHDDTVAIQSCANACNMNTSTRHLVMDVPNGSYKLTDPITFGRVYLEGHGRSSFRLNDNATLLFDHSVETFVKKIGITGDATTHNSIGITFNTCSQLEVEEVFCGDCRIGMQLTNCDITNIERPTVQTCTETGIYLSGCTSINITEGDLYGNNTDFTYGGYNNDITIERNYLENSGDCIVADTTSGTAQLNTLNFERNAVVRNSATSASTTYTDNGKFMNLVVSSNPIRLSNANIKDNRFMFNNAVTELININMNNNGTSYATFNFDNNSVSSDNSTMTHIVKGANIVLDANRINHSINQIGTLTYVSGTFGDYSYLIDDGSAKSYLNGLFGPYKVVISSELTLTPNSDGEVDSTIPYYKAGTSYPNIPLGVIDSNRNGWYARFTMQSLVSATNYTCQFMNKSGTAGSGEYKLKIVYLEHN